MEGVTATSNKRFDISGPKDAVSLEGPFTPGGPEPRRLNSRSSQDTSFTLRGRASEFVQLRKLTLAFLVCVVKQEQAPAHLEVTLQGDPIP